MAKKVWHLVSNRWYSAITEYALSAAKSLEMSGYHATISGLAQKPATQKARELGLSTEPLKGFGFKNLPQFLAIYRRLNPDVIITYGGPETYLSKFCRKKPVIRFFGQDQDLTSQRQPFLARLGFGHIAMALTPSQQLADRLSCLKLPTRSVTLGCDPQKFFFNPNWQPKTGQRPTVCIVGRLDPIKGHGLFFLYFKMLLSQWPSDRPKPLLKIIGEPANISSQTLRLFAKDYGLVEKDHWQLIDYRVDPLAEQLNAAHLGVICSQGSEVICRVAEEFLLCGTPVLVSGVGSLSDCLYDSKAGSSYQDLAGPEVVAKLKGCLITAMDETAALRRQRAESAKDQFSWQSMGQALSESINDMP